MSDPKKNKNKARVILTACIIAALVAVGIFVYLHFFTYRSVKIESFDGEVGLERNGGDKEVFEGLKLIPEDRVATGEDGLVELFIDSDKHVVAEADTRFCINAVGNAENGKVTIDLEYGSTLITIDEKLAEDSEFEVETPNALCSVRGTTFKVTYNKGQRMTRVDVIEGTVHVKAGDLEIDVEAGESVVIQDETVYRVEMQNGVEVLVPYTGIRRTTGAEENEPTEEPETVDAPAEDMTDVETVSENEPETAEPEAEQEEEEADADTEEQDTNTAQNEQLSATFEDWGNHSNPALNQYLESLGYVWTTNAVSLGVPGVAAGCWTPEPEHPMCDGDYSIVISYGPDTDYVIAFTCGMGMTNWYWVSPGGYDTEKLCMIAAKHAAMYPSFNNYRDGETGLIGNGDYYENASFKALVQEFWSYADSLAR